MDPDGDASRIQNGLEMEQDSSISDGGDRGNGVVELQPLVSSGRYHAPTSEHHSSGPQDAPEDVTTTTTNVAYNKTHAAAAAANGTSPAIEHVSSALSNEGIKQSFQTLFLFGQQAYAAAQDRVSSYRSNNAAQPATASNNSNGTSSTAPSAPPTPTIARFFLSTSLCLIVLYFSRMMRCPQQYTTFTKNVKDGNGGTVIKGGASLSVCPTTIHPEWGAIKPIKWYPPLPDDSWFLWRRMIHIPPPYQFILANLHESMLRDPTRILRIVVLGGSMTAGAACKQGNAYNKNCAWGHRLEFQLQSYFGENRVEVTNLARGGTQSEVALGSLYSLLGAIEQKPDILISDYSVNDMYEFGGNTGHTSAIRRDEDDYEKAVAISESLIRGIHEVLGDDSGTKSADSVPLMHIMMLSNCPICTMGSSTLNAMKDIAISENIGLIDLRHLVGEAGQQWPWVGTTHPTFATHQVVSDILSFALFKKGFRMDCHDHILTSSAAKPELVADLPRCMRPISNYDANSLFSSNSADGISTSTKGDFKLIEDRAGKPGWISEKKDSTITFEISFGEVPSLMIMYLRSYEQMGDFTISMNNISMTLHGSWQKNISTIQTFFSQAYSNAIQVDKANANDESHYGIIGFNIQPKSTHNITITNSGISGAPNNTKVKLVAVMSC